METPDPNRTQLCPFLGQLCCLIYLLLSSVVSPGGLWPGSFSGLEHSTENRGVEGSNPPQAIQGLVPIGRTHALGVWCYKFESCIPDFFLVGLVIQRLEYFSYTEKVRGSNPFESITLFLLHKNYIKNE